MASQGLGKCSDCLAKGNRGTPVLGALCRGNYSTSLGVPDYNYSIIYPKTLFYLVQNQTSLEFGPSAGSGSSEPLGSCDPGLQP